jgi:mono/diheme cytochrome c family protein
VSSIEELLVTRAVSRSAGRGKSSGVVVVAALAFACVTLGCDVWVSPDQADSASTSASGTSTAILAGDTPEAKAGSHGSPTSESKSELALEKNKEDTSDEASPIQAAVEESPGRTLGSFSDSQRAALQQRGKYLVTGPGACGSCHSAVDSGIFGPQAILSGGRLMTDQFGQVRAANITPDKQTGIGDWNIDQIVSAVRSSLGKGESRLSLDLHSGYRWLADADADAIAVYLLTLRPVKNEVERRELGYFEKNKFGILSRHIPVSGYVPRPKPGPNSANGRYLANNLSRCMVCHNSSEAAIPETEAGADGEAEGRSAGLGGFRILSLFGSILAMPLTAPSMDKTELDTDSTKLLSPDARQAVQSTVQPGADDTQLDIRSRAIRDGVFPVGGPDIRAGAGAALEAWKGEDIVKYLRTGKNPQGQSRDGRFCPWPNYSTMSDEDLKALAVYLKRLS